MNKKMKKKEKTSEIQKYELELEMLKKNLLEQKEISNQLNELVDQEDKKILKLNDKIETLLQEQKYEIIEIIQTMSKSNRVMKNKISLNKQDYKQLKHEINQKNEEVEELRKQVQHYKSIMLKQTQFIGQYRGSVVFYLYKLTHNFGKTALGKVVEKLIK